MTCSNRSRGLLLEVLQYNHLSALGFILQSTRRYNHDVDIGNKCTQIKASKYDSCSMQMEVVIQ